LPRSIAIAPAVAAAPIRTISSRCESQGSTFCTEIAVE